MDRDRSRDPGVLTALFNEMQPVHTRNGIVGNGAWEGSPLTAMKLEKSSKAAFILRLGSNNALGFHSDFVVCVPASNPLLPEAEETARVLKIGEAMMGMLNMRRAR